jgi:succinoglycan biosynthesis transport protein ExoP
MREIERQPSDLAEYGRLQPYVVPGQYPEMESAQPAVSPTHYLLVIWRQRWRILAFVATCLLVTYLVSSRMTPIYEATAKIDVDRHIPTTVVGQDAGGQISPGEDSENFLATQQEIIQSDAVLRPVAERYNLLQRESQLDRLGSDSIRRRTDAPITLKQLRVTRPLNTYLLDISYRSPDPRLAADVANAIANSFMQHNFDIKLKSNGSLTDFMQKQLDDLRAKMETSSQRLGQFEKEMNVINPEEKTTLTTARIQQLNIEYTQAQAERVRKEAAFNAVQNGNVAAEMNSTQAEELNRLQDRLNQSKQKLSDVQAIYGVNHSEYRKAANDAEEVERQFEEARKNVSARVESDYKQAVNKEQLLAKEVAAEKSEFDKLNSHSFEYNQLKRDAENDKSLYNDLEKRIRESGINTGFQGNSIHLADPARPPDSPVFPRVRLNLLLAFIASLVLAVITAILADVMDNTIRDPEQVARALDTSVLGTLPTVKEMRRLIHPGASLNSLEAAQEEADSIDQDDMLLGAGVIRYKKEEADKKKKKMRGASPNANYEGISSYEEAIRTLRHSILLPDLDRSVKSLLITSAAPGEGKSTAIIHLAIAHAEQGKKTLIIDADLRRPSIHKKLNLNGSLGLSNVLLGEFRWKETIVQNEQWPDLDVVPSGTASRRASDLVGSMMMDILDEASKEYDLILVDAPPLLGFAEAMQVAKSVDGVVVMARAGQTSRRAVATVLATLKRLRANVIGLVLNEVDRGSTNGYYYYSDYRKYYSNPEQLN